MRDLFQEYYPPTDEEFQSIWSTGVVVPDANVLLNLYRYSDTTREELLRTLGAFQGRLWLSHQAALEYQRNRVEVIEKRVSAYGSALSALNESRRLLLETDRTMISADRAKVLDELFGQIQVECSATLDYYRALYQDDAVRLAVDSLFDGSVGSPYDAEQLADARRRAAERYQREQPPGYEDKGKPEERRYGDVILWFQTMQFAKENRAPIMLITDDRKKDWWQIASGATIGPRIELRQEFAQEAGVPFHMYNSEQFLKHATRYLHREVREGVYQEIEEVIVEDEVTGILDDAASVLQGQQAASSQDAGHGLASPDAGISAHLRPDESSAGPEVFRTHRAMNELLQRLSRTSDATRLATLYRKQFCGSPAGSVLSQEVLRMLHAVNHVSDAYQIACSLALLTRIPDVGTSATGYSGQRPTKSTIDPAPPDEASTPDDVPGGDERFQDHGIDDTNTSSAAQS